MVPKWESIAYFGADSLLRLLSQSKAALKSGYLHDVHGAARRLAAGLLLLAAEAKAMMSDAELHQYREECEVDVQWHNVTRHVLAEMLEVCTVCDTVRDKDRLVRCPCCQDAYCCQDGACSEKHRVSMHATAPY